MSTENEIMTQAEAARYLGMSEASLRLLRRQGKIHAMETDSALQKPPIRYRRQDVEAYKRKMLADRAQRYSKIAYAG